MTIKKYNEKRDFNKTKEPKGEIKKKHSKKKIFVVQHHLARKDHYDFRLEIDGVLVSFAVPKGPSYNTQDKRLAIHVEDHPYNYRNFEGVIPNGEYGAGTVMIWDEGYWESEDNPKNFLKKGNLKFTLHGKRLKGKWTLVHFKNEQWLLIKEKDNIKGYSDITKLRTSIRSNRTIKEIEQKKKPQDISDITITNPNKIIFKKPKKTKLDLINYYKEVFTRMFPYLENRLMSTIRCPKGIDGEKFFIKHFKTKGLGKKIIPSDSGKKEDYYYVKDFTSFIREIQMNSYEFHIWGSKANKRKKPDMIVFDLDPDENLKLANVRQGVKDLKSILDDLHLVSFLKTSGGKGYHVVVPIQSLKNWQEAKEFSQNIVHLMEMKWPLKYTSNVRIKNRKGKIFIDWIRNTEGATSVAPYSIRLKKKLSVSMPIRWSELDLIKPNEITIEDAIERLKRKDPWENFFNVVQ